MDNNISRKDFNQLKLILMDVSEQLSRHDCNETDVRDTLNNFTFSITNKLRLMDRQLSSMNRVLRNTLDDIEERVDKCVKVMSDLAASKDPNSRKRKCNILDDLSSSASASASASESNESRIDNDLEKEFDIEDISLLTQNLSPKDKSNSTKSNTPPKSYDVSTISFQCILYGPFCIPTHCSL